MKRTYLITGASGFIGANLVRRLIDQENEIHILTRPSSNLWRLKDLLPNIIVHPVPLKNVQKVKDTIKKIQPQYLLHLAAYGSNSRETDLSEMIQINVLFATTLLQSPTSYRLCVVTGSSSEYGFKQTPMVETDALEPTSLYAATKASMTHIALAFGKTNNKPITIVRPFSVYGMLEGSRRLIPTVILKCLKNEDIALTSGNEAHDFIYIEDFLDCYLAILDNPEQSAGKIINIGSGKQVTTKEIVSLIHTLTKSKSKLLWGSYANHSWDTQFWQADIHLAKRLYNWEPKHHLSIGIQKTINLVKENLHLYETNNVS